MILLTTIVCLFFRGTPSTPLGSEQTAMLLGGGMPLNLMTARSHSEADFTDFKKLIETIGDDWIATGSPKHYVRRNDFIEVDESDGQYMLSIQLWRQDQHLATENRYFISYSGPDGEIEDRPWSFLACAMFSNGFLSGTCELTEVSSTKVTVAPDWTFDDRDANIKSKFDQSFVATIGETGAAECSNGAMIEWAFERKATEPSDAPKPPNGAF